uniref:Heterokaryon incompatibility domain-containing protein n=1 Tax=Bionectria ochroleuca TaxID=29856 RepID=A0A0B7JMX6_BIOOC
MSLCALCKTIPSNLFSSGRKEQCSLAHHENVPALEASATAGCPMCAVMLGAMRRRADQDGQLRSTFGKPVDPSKQVQLRNTKFGAQWVCVDWADVGSLRGIEVPEGWDDRLVAAPELSESSNLSRETGTLRWWLKTCWEAHEECKKDFDSSYVPSRLVDVQDSETGTVRLVLTKGAAMEDKRYVAASHCWGLNMPTSAKTVAANHDQHTTSIRIEDLSKTFADMIKITRDIGVRYVWIDSLCIIQDSRADWEAEASQMAAVYSNAYVTVAASGSSDGTGGCRLGDSKDVHVGPADLSWEETSDDQNRGTSSAKTIRVFGQPDIQTVNVLMQDPLIKRGWTLQERELSPRVAHYSKDSIRWECATLKATLEFPWEDKLPFNMALRAFDMGQIRQQDEKSTYYGDENVQKNALVWYEVVERYSKRSLTKQSDVLPAISGIARYFAKQTGDVYHAGLFASHGPMALTWKVQGEWKKEAGKSERPKDYLAPSWSWASVKGTVDWFNKRDGSRPIDTVFTPEILELSTEPAGNDPFGMLVGGRLRMRGLFTPAAALWREGDNLQADERSIMVPGPDGLRKVGNVIFDVPSEACQVVFCFACRREEEYGWIDALALVPSGELDASTQFKRVGLIRSKDKSWWENAHRIEINII